jgi:hypothetical protein
MPQHVGHPETDGVTDFDEWNSSLGCPQLDRSLCYAKKLGQLLF